MKRFVPLLITFLGGFFLIIAYFIPYTQNWGEIAAIWFDILAAIAFILGGGNLLKMHLKKISDRAAGWGYSAVTMLSFLTMLFVGLFKIGAPPAPNQEFYGQRFAELPLSAVPVEFSVEGQLPEVVGDLDVHSSVLDQISARGDRIYFRGWLRNDQLVKLLEFKDELEWQCRVERLAGLAQAEGPLAGRINYYADHDALGFLGHMTAEQREALLALADTGDVELSAEEKTLWREAVAELEAATATTTEVEVLQELLPSWYEPEAMPGDVIYDPGEQKLIVTGPMTRSQLAALAEMFPKARPMSEGQRAEVLSQLEQMGSLEPEQVATFDTVLEGLWSVEIVVELLNVAGQPAEVEKTACEMEEEQEGGAEHIEPTRIDGEPVTLNEAQIAAIGAFAENGEMKVSELIEQLWAAGDFPPRMASALSSFFATVPTQAELKRDLAFAMMKSIDESGRRLTLNEAQREYLLDDFQAQIAWRQKVGELFVLAHEVKYPWSGEYRAQGTPFWWLYEYAFKPLQATIFAMLAFYVASAAFRAFRAKNFEAILLLGTAFIILLGRTFAGVYLTSWIDADLWEGFEHFTGLRIENMTVYIMQVFNTAGNRAIMIGIALGIASTSLKVLLGVDRSYLGSSDE